MASSRITEYDVFVSFRGEEIRRTFVSHLYRSLEQKGIRAFIKDVTSKPSESHLDAIRTSKIAIVVVCNKYVSSSSSRWILEELQEILNHQRNGYLTVFPIYYGVDANRELGTDQEQNPEKVAWRDALKELSYVSGQHSNQWEDDSELILKITDDIWHKLSSLRFSGLVGKDLPMRRIYELLRLEDRVVQVRVIGICGRAGLGKGTLARCAYKEISHSFDVCVFLEHFDRSHRHHHPFILRQEIRSELTLASGGLYTISGDDSAAWLMDQRVLLVVEALGTAEQLDILKEDSKLFGPGSRVIVICEDKQLLLSCGITLLYQVEPLQFYEARELLTLQAFKHTHPPIEHEQLIARAIKIGNGYPWVVSAIGSELFGRTKDEWETVLSKYDQSSEDGTVGTKLSDFGGLYDEDKSIAGDQASNCVGMDRHLQAVCRLLELESGDETRIVAIWGVGGVGKTTLARFVYKETKHYFHTHIFLENVGKIYQDLRPPGSHEELLWKHIQREAFEIRSSSNSSDVTKARLENRKVLLIVDDVDDNERIKDVQKVTTFFGAGSRVLVTTRDENLLQANGLEHVYEVKCLEIHEALQLFYYFAFMEQSPCTRFKQLAVRAVQLAGRIPLSLKVLGSFLRGKSGHEWEKVLQKLERQQVEDKAEVMSIYEGVGSDDDNLNMPDGSDMKTSEAVIMSPENHHKAATGSMSGYERDCIPLWGKMSTCGERSNMEDAVRVMPYFLEIPIKMLMHDQVGRSSRLKYFSGHFFGVYDGQGGARVAEYFHRKLHFYLARQIKLIEEEMYKINTGEGRHVIWAKVFSSCFRRFNDEVAAKISSPSARSSDRSFEATPETARFTALVALVCSSHIIIANSGDSRAVLYRGNECMPLSVYHSPDREDELVRIETAGGKVLHWGPASVSGSLRTSRSFIGERFLEAFITPNPEVTFMPRAREDECLILASDGLWCVVSNQEACELARKRLLLWHKKSGALPLGERGVAEDHACQAAADYLGKLALQRGSKDNISIIVVDLKAGRNFLTKS